MKHGSRWKHQICGAMKRPNIPQLMWETSINAIFPSCFYIVLRPLILLDAWIWTNDPLEWSFLDCLERFNPPETQDNIKICLCLKNILMPFFKNLYRTISVLQECWTWLNCRVVLNSTEKNHHYHTDLVLMSTCILLCFHQTFHVWILSIFRPLLVLNWQIDWRLNLGLFSRVCCCPLLAVESESLQQLFVYHQQPLKTGS